jgi:hypothetical protein
MLCDLCDLCDLCVERRFLTQRPKRAAEIAEKNSYARIGNRPTSR